MKTVFWACPRAIPSYAIYTKIQMLEIYYQLKSCFLLETGFYILSAFFSPDFSEVWADIV
jgi:hypothetical protein